jgi:DNA-binding NarL/FixJ family response regulator
VVVLAADRVGGGAEFVVPGSTQPLAGRDHELELLAQLLGAACAGSPRIVFVTGEPGIGKTALLTTLLRSAEQRGCLALNGSASEFARELPFGPLVDALDEYLESLDPQAFHRLATDELRELAGVFPALGALDPGSEEPGTAAERYRAHRAVRALIERLAVKQPVVLLLDDLHWADGASLELTSHLLRRPPRGRVVVALALRPGQAARGLEREIDAAVSRSDSVHRIVLGPLAPADAEMLVGPLDPGARGRIYRASGGNPFYLLELARMHDDGSGVAGEADVPAAVVTSIAGELDGLSAPARRLAVGGAVAGDPFGLDLAIATAAIPESDALAAIDELVGRDLVRSEAVPRRFRFRHPLVRHAVYESCAPGARLAAHGHCASALAAQGAPAAMRAHHVAHAAPPGDLAAVAVLREAGESAAQRAPASAARWFALALGLLPEAAPAGDRFALLMPLAAAQAATGRFEDSRGTLLEGLALTDGDQQELRGELIGMCASLEQRLGHHEEAHARLAGALARLPDRSSPQAVELMIHLAVGGLYRMDLDAAREWGERALDGARALGNRPLAVAATALLASAYAFTGQVEESRARSSEAAALADALPDAELGRRLDALANLCTAELYIHRYGEAAAHARRALAIGKATGQEDIAPVLVPVLANVLHMWGRIRESAELADEAIEAARLSGNVEALGWNLLARAYTAVAAGDVEIALATATESVELTRDLDDSLVSAFAGIALAHAHYEAGEAGRAVELLLTAAGGEELPLVPDGWRANYFELLTRCRLALGRQADAEHAAAHAESLAERVRLPLAEAMAHRAAAAVALERGDPAAAAERAFAAVGAAETIDARVDAAVARTLAGRALAASGDRGRAVSELQRAAESLDACGAVRYRSQAEQELRRLGRHPYRRTRPKDAGGVGIETLTEREVQIARLAARRRTNPEIASELFLSVKTIETHMRNIFRKLDVSSRLDLAPAIQDAEPAAQSTESSRPGNR